MRRDLSVCDCYETSSPGDLMPPLPWVERLARRLTRWRQNGRLAGPWVVGVSGGSDSVGLLRVLHELTPRLGLDLTVAHLDHGVRAESALDGQFVADLADSLELPFDLGHWKPTRSGHFEADARAARYAWLVEIARTRGACAVVVGHTRDDQAETILHRIVRGTGPSGLTGMAWRRPLTAEISLIRPLLSYSHNKLCTYLASLNQSWREDATNLNQVHTRARLRHDLLPKLAAEYNPNVAQALVRLGKLMDDQRRGFETLAADFEHQATVESSALVIDLDLSTLREIPHAFVLEVVRRAWRHAGWPERDMDARRWQRIASLAGRERGRISVGMGVDASIVANLLRLNRAEVIPAVPLESIELPIPGVGEWQGGRVIATHCDHDHDGITHDEMIDLARVVPPLQITSPRDGDRFDPLGLKGQTTPLADFLRGRGLGQTARRSVPVVRDQVGIVWVVRHRIAERVRLTDSTTERLGLSWQPSCD